jgi:hypothetical protein
VNVTNAGALAATLVQESEQAMLFRTLATLRTDVPLFKDIDELRWKGPTAAFDEIGPRLDAAVTEKSSGKTSGKRRARAPLVAPEVPVP